MKASRVAAEQAKTLASLNLLVIALCEKQGINVDEVLGITEPLTRDEMKAYATKLPAPAPVAPVEPEPAPVVPVEDEPAAKEAPAKSRQSKFK